MRKISRLFFWGLVMAVSSCEESGFERYKKLEKKELSDGKRVDSIFFGLHFGMSPKQFYASCWEMNKKGLFTDGSNNTAVLYKLHRNELKHPASMNFYPDFKENSIYKMKVTFQYDGWAPWNKQLYADSLLQDLVNYYSKWYNTGNPFIRIDDKEKGSIYVKVDGNRRITLGKFDDVHVKADYTDLTKESTVK